MTPDDAQIDVLMRRYAGQNRGDAAADHLDADELNAFAEGLVPPATRARYVSHLADCDNCRQLVSQLAISAGAVAKLEPAGAAAARASWWQSLFTPAKLKYAAFAVVLIAAVGTLFLYMQRPPQSNLITQNEPGGPPPGSAVKSDQAVPQASVAQRAATNANETATRQQNQLDQERDESRVSKDAPPPPKPSDTLAMSPPLADKKAAEQPPASKSGEPSYAPPPPREGQRVEQRAEIASRGGENTAGVVSGPRKSQSSIEKMKTTDLAKETEVARDRRGDDDAARARANSPVPANRRAGEKPGGPQRNADNIASTGRSSSERQVEEQKQSPASPAKTESAPETRSVGGRKFRRQGGSWIDTKFKSSMSLKTVSRGSEEFSSLDSGLRSIASQFSGEIIVVWKNKAYRIQ